MNKTLILLEGVFLALLLSSCAAPVKQGAPLDAVENSTKPQELEVKEPVEAETPKVEPTKALAQEVPIETSKPTPKEFKDSVERKKDTIPAEENFLPIPPQTDTLAIEKKSPEPFIEIQKIVAESFSHAEMLFNEGKVDSAIQFLETFQMLDPLWKTWMNNTTGEIEKYKAASLQELQKYKSLCLSIINEMAVGGDYNTIRYLADSLIALAPGDSLQQFAESKKKQSYEKTMQKVKSEMQKIETKAKEDGNYQKADSLAKRLQMRYRDFSDTLHLDTWVKTFQEIANSQNENKDFWKTHNPEEFLGRAKKLGAEGKVEDALKILKDLLSSSLRDKAIEEKNRLGKTYCDSSRANAASLYTKALKQKNQEKKKKSIEDALNALSLCIENFPSLREAKQAEKDKKLLLEELAQ